MWLNICHALICSLEVAALASRLLMAQLQIMAILELLQLLGTTGYYWVHAERTSLTELHLQGPRTPPQQTTNVSRADSSLQSQPTTLDNVCRQSNIAIG
jgi:hypothetical protein